MSVLLYTSLSTLHSTQLPLLHLGWRLLWHDELFTMSARALAWTGDTVWLDR